MKYLLAILLSLSIYTPDIAKLVAYVDYVVDIASAEKINLCDCQDVLEKQDDAENHQQHKAVVKNEWTYIVTEVLIISSIDIPQQKLSPSQIDSRLCQMSFDIFHPPRV